MNVCLPHVMPQLVIHATTPMVLINVYVRKDMNLMERVVLVCNQKCIEAYLHESYNKSHEILNYVHLLKVASYSFQTF